MSTKLSGKIKITFLGTNGWYDTNTGNTICILIETKKEFIILDAGNGLYKIDRYIDSSKKIYLFLSHFHLDHIIGLHILDKFNFTKGIDIYGPFGTKKIISEFIKPPFTKSIAKLRMKVRLNDLSKINNLPIDVRFKNLSHSTICYGYRFRIDSKIISYCSDTGVCENLYTLAKNADLLIAECSFKSGQKDKNWSHLNPEDAARVAHDSKAKRLVLIHFDASLYLTLKDRKDAEKQAEKNFKNSFSAVDDMQITL